MKTLYSKPVKAIVLHHTGSNPGDLTVWNAIIEYSKRQWADKWQPYTCDYHWGVGTSGRIFKGQPEIYFAIHAGIDEWDYYQDESGVNNQNSIAIAAIGNFETSILPEAQLQGIVDCIKDVKSRYPKAFIKIHRELVATDCPGYKYNYPEIFRRLDMKFKDVDPKRWSFPAIDWVSNEKIMKGDEYGFRPKDSMTREEMAQILFNLHKLGKL